MKTYVRIALLPLVFVFAPNASAQTATKSDSVVALRFAWPADLTARVGATRYRERINAAKSDTMGFDYRYTMTVSKHPEGRLIRHTDFEFAAHTANTSDRLALNEQLAALLPGIIVSDEGAFVRTDNIAALKVKMDSMVANVPTAGLPQQAKELLANMTSESVLNALAAQNWNAGVGIWVGADFKIGTVYESEESAPIAFFPGETLAMVTQFEIVGRVPCIEHSRQNDCVELHMVAAPDEGAVKALLKKMMDMAVNLPASDAPMFDKITIETDITLIAEPATLIPHYYSLTKTTGGSFTVMNKKGSFSQTEEQTATYTYLKN